MGIVTRFLSELIQKQVDEKGLVVWYDPEQAYGSVAAEVSLPETTMARFDGSFLKLRKEIDHLMNDGQPPRLVIYVPIEREKTHSALIELDSAGVIVQPRAFAGVRRCLLFLTGPRQRTSSALAVVFEGVA